MMKAIKSKHKKSSRWGYLTIKLLLIVIKQLSKHLSSKNLLIWMELHLNSLLLCSLLIACFKVRILRFFKILRNLNLALLHKICLISKKKGMSKDMRRLSSLKSFMWLMSRLTFWCLSLKKNRFWQLPVSHLRLLNCNIQHKKDLKFKKLTDLINLLLLPVRHSKPIK